jgi:hypothetical protein
MRLALSRADRRMYKTKPETYHVKQHYLWLCAVHLKVHWHEISIFRFFSKYPTGRVIPILNYFLI